MVLTDLILRAKLPIGIFSLETGRLHTETLAHAGPGARRTYGYDIALYQPASPRRSTPTSQQNGLNAFYDSVEMRKECCRIRKVEPLGRALAGKRAWITGQRRAQSATRAELAVQEDDAAHGMAKFNPLADWSEEDVWNYIRGNDVPYNALHDRAIRRSAASPAPARSSRARTCAPAAGGGKTRTRRNAACTWSTANSSASNPWLHKPRSRHPS